MQPVLHLPVLPHAPRDELRLREFKAGLPGSTRVEATGLFPSADDPTAFEGDVVLRGANLGRFLTWAGVSSVGTDARNDGAFSLRSLLPMALAK